MMESSGAFWILWTSFSPVPMDTASPMQASVWSVASEVENPRDSYSSIHVLYMGLKLLADGGAQGPVGNLVGYLVRNRSLSKKNTSHHLVDSGFIDPPFLFFFN